MDDNIYIYIYIYIIYIYIYSIELIQILTHQVKTNTALKIVQHLVQKIEFSKHKIISNEMKLIIIKCRINFRDFIHNIKFI